MPKVARLNIYQTEISKGNRSQAYLDYAHDLLNSGIPGAIEAYHQIMIQVQISSYSGATGGAAIYGNYWAMNQAQQDGLDYMAVAKSLDDFSVDVARLLFAALFILFLIGFMVFGSVAYNKKFEDLK